MERKTRCPFREGARTGKEFSETYTPTPSIPYVRMYVIRRLISIRALQTSDGIKGRDEVYKRVKIINELKTGYE